MDLLSGSNSNSSANVANRGRGGGNGRGRGRGGGRGRSGGRQGGGRGGHNGDRPTCQLCGKEGHTVIRCYKRFDASFTGASDPKSASSATTNYGADSNWYMDTGATNHITGELDKLTIRDKYSGGDQVHTASGAGVMINHIGHGTLHTPSGDIVLRNILHVPQASKNLASVHRIAKDNNAFLEFHPNHFFIKEQATKRTILRGRCEGGLYPLKSSPNKQACSAINKPTTSLWHSRLGHAALPVVHQVLRRNNLSFSSDPNKGAVCDACQQGKSHQLPYPRSSSVSRRPLDLIFSDVWGPAPSSFGRYNYYVSFIDDFSKFTWIYLLRHKSEVFQRFTDFQNLVERLFNRKIVAVQTDWGGEYQRLNSFF
jgi:histone deacetylase 1/2